jgi:hypothetical protein
VGSRPVSNTKAISNLLSPFNVIFFFFKSHTYAHIFWGVLSVSIFFFRDFSRYVSRNFNEIFS